jgi:hypothetical protein
MSDTGLMVAVCLWAGANGHWLTATFAFAFALLFYRVR